jgi:hypothetical protein
MAGTLANPIRLDPGQDVIAFHYPEDDPDLLYATFAVRPLVRWDRHIITGFPGGDPDEEIPRPEAPMQTQGWTELLVYEWRDTNKFSNASLWSGSSWGGAGGATVDGLPDLPGTVGLFEFPPETQASGYNVVGAQFMKREIPESGAHPSGLSTPFFGNVPFQNSIAARFGRAGDEATGPWRWVFIYHPDTPPPHAGAYTYSANAVVNEDMHWGILDFASLLSGVTMTADGNTYHPVGAAFTGEIESTSPGEGFISARTLGELWVLLAHNPEETS